MALLACASRAKTRKNYDCRIVAQSQNGSKNGFVKSQLFARIFTMSTSPTKNQKLSTEPYKGVRDFYPEEMAIQNYIFDVWKKTAKEAGYAEYGASILEPAELYRAKSGDEIVNEQMFTFTDRGDREVALRPEMTPTLARLVAGKRKSLKFPLRWFSIPNLFRYERPQRGRRREHWQLNCDLIGVSGTEGDVEIIELAYKIMRNFGAKDEDFEIRINDRGQINQEIQQLLRDPKDLPKALRMIDARRKKADEQEFENDWQTVSDKPFTLNVSPAVEDTLKTLSKKNIGNASYDQNIVRGLDYYTGIVFEVFDTNPENRRSLFGGGRYDNLLEIFGVEPVPTVGFGMGDITIRDFLETHNLPLTPKN